MWFWVSSQWVSQVTTLQMKIRLPFAKTKSSFLSVFLLSAALFLPPRSSSSSVSNRHQSLCSSVFVQQAHEYCFYFLLTCLFACNPGQLKILFGVIIKPRNGSHIPFSTLEVCLLLGLPYFRLPHYVRPSLLCSLHLHIDSYCMKENLWPKTWLDSIFYFYFDKSLSK